MFGNKIVDDKTNHSDTMCHMIDNNYADNKINEVEINDNNNIAGVGDDSTTNKTAMLDPLDNEIDTIAKSRAGFSFKELL